MVIGITGGIGAGKSTVIDILKEKGLPILSADQVSRDVMTAGSPVVMKLAEVFGADLLDKDGNLDRKELAARAFTFEENVQMLNSITQNAIKAELADRIIEEKYMNPDRHVIVEIPLLYESGWDDLVDKVWTVTADEKTRMQRVMKRDNINKRKVRARMNFQMDEEEKISKADLVIYNNGTEEELRIEIERALRAMSNNQAELEEKAENG